MIMREMVDALGFTPEQQAAADELVPGWRDLEPAEFVMQSHTAAERILAEGAALRRVIRNLREEP